MEFNEEEQRVIDQAHKELDEQIRRAKRQRLWGKVGIFIMIQQGISKRLGIVCDVTIDSKKLE